MSARRGHAGRREGADAPGIRVAVVAGIAVGTLVVALLVLSSPALAQDASPPTFGNGTAVNDTTMAVTVEDDGGVDESSISPTDFSLSTGSIDSINVSERGNDSVVSIHLDDRVRSENVTVSLASGETIADDAGNELTDGSVTVTGADGYAPFLKEYEVSWVANSTVEIAFYVDERLENVSLAVKGRESALLGPGDFRETDTSPANEFRYDTNYTFDAEGEYRITLELVADASGNRGLYFADRTVVHDVTSPEARLTGPTTATAGQGVAFDGSESSDAFGVSSYRWAVDGNETSTNETFAYVFDEPGRHEVELTVEDGRGNSDTARHPVEVLDATTAEDVTITPTNGTGVDVVVGPNRTKQRVLVERSGGLASNGSILLDTLTLTVPTNASANLSTAAASGIPDQFDEADATGFGTFDVDHEGASVSDVTFRFSVNRTVLENASVPLDGVSLYRESGGWTRLPTLRVGGNDSHVQYRATSPGLSSFVVAGSDGPTDDESTEGSADTSDDGGGSTEPGGESAFSVRDGSLLTSSVSLGDPVIARATIVNDGNATGTYVAGLTVDGSVVRTTAVTVPAGAEREVTIAGPATGGGAVELNGTSLGTVSMGNGPAVTEQADDGSGGGLSIPNPLTLWPGGLVGRALGAMFWLVVVAYTLLKSLAIYLGY